MFFEILPLLVISIIVLVVALFFSFVPVGPLLQLGCESVFSPWLECDYEEFGLYELFNL